MSLPVRVATLLVAFAAVVVGAVFVVVHYLVSTPSVVDYSSVASGGQVNVVLQEDPQNNSATKPDWVSYFVQNPQTHVWEHTTLFKVPANTQVNMTILGYDGCTPLRNNFWSQVDGTLGNTVSVQQYNKGQALGPAKTVSVINGWSSCAVGHTFAIPSLHLFVPVASPGAAIFNKYACGSSPCTPSSGAYAVEKFAFRTPAHTGVFRWQCFVPCGGGFIDGNGGPMQTFGYMTGQMEVTA